MPKVRPPAMSPVTRLVRALLRSRSGNILPLAAGAIFAVAALIGGAVDISRAWRAQSRLQAACDAAVLAGRTAVTSAGYNAAAEAKAQTFFDANFDEDRYGSRDTAFTSSSADKGGTIDGRATTILPPLIMQIFGYDPFELTSVCTASMGVGNNDIMMVLDTTGSMSEALKGTTQTRIEALRTSMKSFYKTLENIVSGSNARVRYGFVPYSSTVNVGHLLVDLDPAYLADSWTVQSRKPIYRSVQTLSGYGTPTTGTPATSYSNPTYSAWANYNSTTYLSSSSCNAVKPADTAWTNSGTATTTSVTTINGSGQQVVTRTTTQPQTATLYGCNFIFILTYRLQSRTGSRNAITTTTSTANAVYTTTQVFDHWEYRPVTYDTSRYKLFEAVSTNTGENGVAFSSTWNGCIEERATVSEPTFAFSSLGGITPTGAQDLDIDTPPDGSSGSKWAPMWGQVSYIRTVTDRWGNVYVNDALPSPTGQKVPADCPAAAQVLEEMDSDAFSRYVGTLSPAGATYHDIGMTWGGRMLSPDGPWSDLVREKPDNGGEVSRHLIFMTDGIMSPYYGAHTAWGVEYHDRRVTDDGYTDDGARHNSRLLTLCEAVKAKGIRVWVIVFAQDMTAPLQACASSGSAFTASNASQLESAFQSIAKQVGELRVVQ